jgi:hypothetical protein
MGEESLGLFVRGGARLDDDVHALEKNNHRKDLVKRFAEKRKALLAIANDESREMEERLT